jgi:hypothetical protein
MHKDATGSIMQSVISGALVMTTPQESTAAAFDPIFIAKTVYRAYVDKNRSILEPLIANDFHFTSPLDNRIDRRTYFERCWPNSEWITDFRFIYTEQVGERVFVTYEGHSKSGRGFRNTEILTIQNGKIIDAEVYFGWSLPHEAPSGNFIDSSTEV